MRVCVHVPVNVTYMVISLWTLNTLTVLLHGIVNLCQWMLLFFVYCETDTFKNRFKIYMYMYCVHGNSWEVLSMQCVL